MVITGPITGGEHGWAFGGPLLDFAALGYSSEEYFLDGTASRYAPKEGTELDREGKWDVEPCESAPFKTRFVVYRPLDGTKFNGTVIVSWNNVSAGHDLFGGDSRELRRRRLRVRGRHDAASGCAWHRSDEPRPRRLGQGSLRLALDLERRLLVRHLHPGRARRRA